MTNRRPTVNPEVLSPLFDPEQSTALEAEYAAWQAEIAQREQAHRRHRGDQMTVRELTAKEELFARQVALDGKSYSDAYRASRDCSKMSTGCINSNAKKMMRRESVRARVAELRKKGIAGVTGLTPKQEKFVFAYLETSCASQAYRQAYDVGVTTKPETVNREAKALLDNPKIATRLTELRGALQKRHEITVDRIKEEYARLAFANMLDYIARQPDGSARLDLTAVTPEQMAAVQEMTFETVLSSNPDALAAAGVDPDVEDAPKRVTVVKTKFKLHDKKGPLSDLGKHLGMFKADNDQVGRAAAEAAAAAAEVSNRDLARAVLDILREAQIATSPSTQAKKGNPKS